MSPTSPWTPQEIAEAVHGEILTPGSGSAFTGVALDSRKAGPGDLFVAIVGENHDAHGFIPQVLEKGGAGFVLQAGRGEALGPALEKAGAFSVIVPDTVRALGDLAGWHRRRMQARILGITGTNGKTTTKEMLYSVFSRKYKTLKNTGNLNNHIGVPQTLLALNPEHEWAIVEMGMNHPGEIRYLAEMAAPGTGLVTNVGPGHLEGLGTVEGVARAKQELFEAMEDGIAVVNADDPFVAAMGRDFVKKGRVITFGFSEGADVWGKNLTQDAGGISMELLLEEKAQTVRMRAYGRHMAANALAAAAGAHAAGIGAQDIAQGLASFSPVAGRFFVSRLKNGAGLVDDTYNANPASMERALETLMAMKGNGRAVAVLGDMFELGGDAPAAHERLGRAAASAGVDALYLSGENAAHAARGARRGGMRGTFIFVGSKEDIARTLVRDLEENDWVLVKGSRGMAMETVVKRLVSEIGTEASE